MAWTGDGNNVAASWIQAAARLGFRLTLACPPQLNPENRILDWARREGADITLTDDPVEAVDRRRLRRHRYLGVDGPAGRGASAATSCSGPMPSTSG